MARLLLIATGGTIASRHTVDGVVPALTGADLAARLGEGLPGADVVVDELSCVQSYSLTPADQLAIALRAVAAVTDDGFDGVVITHGTDTVADTAWWTHLVLGPRSGRIAFATAMRHDDEVGADGPRNLVDCGRFTLDPAARGVVVVAGGEVHSAAWVVKEHSTAVSTFHSPGRCPIGNLFSGELVLHTTPPVAPGLPGAPQPAPVGAVCAWAGHGDRLIDALIAGEVAGVVVEGTGAGNVAASATGGIARALTAGIPVVVTSRATGPTHSDYAGGPGSGAWLADHGVWSGGGLRTSQAQIALSLALGTGDSRAWFDAVAQHREVLPGR